jgi:chemotaxis signal transduction protein
MGIYKGIQVADSLDAVIKHMPDVAGYCEELSSLGQTWDLLSTLGQMTGGAANVADTREGFRQLAAQLLSQLGTETLRKSVQQITSKAQVTVDIVIRNLFERTADIGFLTTDDDVRTFLAQRGNPAPLVSRFREYVAKYSVYHDIVLLDTGGQVLARIEEQRGMGRSSDPLIAEALTTSSPYVETFRASDLVPGETTPLIYAYRVTATNDPRSKPIGVLCLCFRFANEMAGIFRNLSNEHDWSVMTLLDEHGAVIASSDAHQVPLGITMPLVVKEPFKIVRFAGREYLATTCATKGYQGYMGPGWYGHVLAPLDHVFDRDAARSTARLDERVLAAVTRNQQLFAAALQRIPDDADAVQRDLDRAVWNGNIQQEGRSRGGNSESAAKVLLWEIRKTGGRTKNVFERSIGNLHETVVSSLLNDVEFLASLAIDVMDRNLYERANDCRWWALTTMFRERLAASNGGAGGDDLAAILRYINGLYTVYANLFVYDRAGTIRAVSNASQQHLVGKTLHEPWVGATLALSSSQQYTVCPFRPTEMYDGKPTYIYGAAIAKPGASREVVGGIGIVFDSRPQFQAMLTDALPRDAAGGIVAGSFGVYAERDHTVVSSTSADLTVGDRFDIDDDLFTLPPGTSTSRIVEWRGQYYAVGVRSSAGYREYKGSGDSYRNAVVSCIFVPLGDAAAMTRTRQARSATIAVGSGRGGGPVTEVATFFVGQQWIGVRSETVVEALGAQRITPLPGGAAGLAGVTLFRGRPIPVLTAHALFGGVPAAQSQVVVMRAGTGFVGLLIDELGEIPEVPADQIAPVATAAGEETFVEGIVRPGEGESWPSLLLLVDPSRLCSTMLGARADDLAARLDRAA